MNRPEGISESAWDKANKVCMDAIRDGEKYGPVIIARAIQSSVEAERAAIADFCEAQAPTVVGKLFADLIRKGA